MLGPHKLTQRDSRNKMPESRVSVCLCLVVILSGPSLAKAQDTDLDQPEEFSNKLQQFLLEKIKEAEIRDDYEEYEDLAQGNTGRLDLEEDDQPEIIDEDITEDEVVVEGSGEESEPEVIVLNAAPFRMSSVLSDLQADIELQEVSGSSLLNMVCRVTVSNQSDLFSQEKCLPQIYLVSGQDCNSLSQEFSAKQLAVVHGPGEGTSTVDATWSELPGKCLVVLRQNDCQESGEAEEEEDQSGGDTIVDTRRQFRTDNILTAAGFGRSYTTFSLASFSVLSAGTSSVFTITKPTLSYSGPVPSGIVATKYDRLATLPYLQLSGWTQREAIFIVLAMIAVYFLYAYVSANLISIEPMRRKFFNDVQLDRFDAINDGLSLITETYLMSLSSPWRKIAQNIDKNLLKRPTTSQNKFLRKSGKFSSQRSDIYNHSEQN